MKMGIKKRYVVLVGVLKVIAQQAKIATIVREALADKVGKGQISEGSAQILIDEMRLPEPPPKTKKKAVKKKVVKKKVKKKKA